MKTFKDINRQLSEEFNLPLKVVESHTGAYWSEIRKRLNNPQDDLIRVIGLGVWRATPQKLFKMLAAFLINLRRIKLGKVPEKAVYAVNGEAREQFPKLWSFKNRMGWRLTSRRPSPKQRVQLQHPDCYTNPTQTIPDESV